MQVNCLAIFVCTVLSMVLGFTWYGPLFGKKWAQLEGLNMSVKPSQKVMMRCTLIGFFSALILCTGTAYAISILRNFGLAISGHEPTTGCAVMMSVSLWFFFLLPLQLNKAAWEMKSWALVFLNAGFEITRLAMVALIFWHWI